MGIVVNTNATAMFSNMYLGRANSGVRDAMQKLASGSRINSAKDDAAGLGISNQLTALTRGLGVAIRNGNDALSISQVAEGAMVEQTQMLLRMRDLALQAANGSNGAEQRLALDAEMAQLQTEISRIADTTTFGTEKLLNGFFETKAFQVGPNAWEHLYVDIENTSSSAMGFEYSQSEQDELKVIGSGVINSTNGIKDVRTLEVKVDENLYKIDLEYSMTAEELENKINSIKGLSDVNVDLLNGTGSSRAIQGSGLEKVDVFKDTGFTIGDFRNSADTAAVTGTATFQDNSTMTLHYNVFNSETQKMDKFSFVADISGVNSDNKTELADRLADAINLKNVNSPTFEGAKNDRALRGLHAARAGDALVVGFKASEKYNLSPELAGIEMDAKVTGTLGEGISIKFYNDEQQYGVGVNGRKEFLELKGTTTTTEATVKTEIFASQSMAVQTALEADENVLRGAREYSLVTAEGNTDAYNNVYTTIGAAFNPDAEIEYDTAAEFSYRIQSKINNAGVAKAITGGANPTEVMQYQVRVLDADGHEIISKVVGDSYTNIAAATTAASDTTIEGSHLQSYFTDQFAKIKESSADMQYYLTGEGSSLKVYTANGVSKDVKIEVALNQVGTAASKQDSVILTFDNGISIESETDDGTNPATSWTFNNSAQETTVLRTKSSGEAQNSGSNIAAFDVAVTRATGTANEDREMALSFNIKDQDGNIHSFGEDFIQAAAGGANSAAGATIAENNMKTEIKTALENFNSGTRSRNTAKTLNELGITASYDNDVLKFEYLQESSTSDIRADVMGFVLENTGQPTAGGGNVLMATDDSVVFTGHDGSRAKSLIGTYDSGSSISFSQMNLLDKSNTTPAAALEREAEFILDFSNFKADTGIRNVSFSVDEDVNGMRRDIELSDELFFVSVADVNIRTFEASQQAVVAIDQAMAQIASSRAELGAIQNRAMHTGNNNQNIQVQVSEANSRILDLDFAEASTNLAKVQVLQQTSAAMLTQANQITQLAMQLVQG